MTGHVRCAVSLNLFDVDRTFITATVPLLLSGADLIIKDDAATADIEGEA